MLLRYRSLTAALLATLLPLPALAFDGVVASIKPVHSLVSAVMQGVGEPTLLVKEAGSPHSYSMRPSEARALEKATLVFWIGEGLEPFLTRPLHTLGADASIIELSKAPGLVELPFREGGPFEAHDHDHDHDHDHGDDQEHHHAHDDHHRHGIDMHLWLDPANAKAFVAEIERALSKADPESAHAYSANAAQLSAKLDALADAITSTLQPVGDKAFIVFHDAYQYFENRFGVVAAGSITVSPEAIPGAQRLNDMKEKVAQLGATCIFAEPQFEPRLLSVVAEGTQARTGVLDPLGAHLEDGPELYFDLMRNLATSLATCLGTED